MTKETYSILKQLQQESGKLAKAQIIRDNQSNQEFCEVMSFLMNTFITTGLSKSKISKRLPPTKYCTTLRQLLDYVTANNTGRDSDISIVHGGILEISNMDSEISTILYELVTKELKLGVSDETWNKNCSPTYIVPVFNVMLAKSYDDHKNKVKGNFVITQKLDGSRILCLIHDSGKVEFRTRQGKEYTGLNQIEEEIQKLDIKGYVLDGEIIADVEGTSFEVFAQTAKARSKSDDKRNFLFHIFDIVPMGEFITGLSPGVKKLGAIERKLLLHDILSKHSLKYVKEVEPLYIGNEVTAIEKWSGVAVEKEWEGIMVSLDTPYECKRTHNLLKVKQFHTIDVKIIGIEEGESRLSGTLGNLIVAYKGGKVGVGIGFSDSLRKEIWNNQEQWIGRVVELKYFEESQDSEGKKSLRFPVFLRLRELEKEVSYH